MRYSSLMGWGADFNASALGEIGVWGSKGDGLLPGWLGTSIGGGFTAGASGGVSYTIPIGK